MTIQLKNDLLPCAGSVSGAGYLVLEQNPIIADDIKAALETAGAMNVVLVSDVNGAAKALETMPGVIAAFLELRLSALMVTGLDHALDALGAQVILTAGEDEESAVLERGYHLLIRPFSEKMIHQIIARRDYPDILRD